jgi:hypothetical protein
MVIRRSLLKDSSRIKRWGPPIRYDTILCLRYVLIPCLQTTATAASSMNHSVTILSPQSNNKGPSKFKAPLTLHPKAQQRSSSFEALKPLPTANRGPGTTNGESRQSKIVTVDDDADDFDAFERPLQRGSRGRGKKPAFADTTAPSKYQLVRADSNIQRARKFIGAVSDDDDDFQL